MQKTHGIEDLNLMRVFTILAAERSVTAAAKRLGLSQSAVSHRLKQLRDRFEDPLFVPTKTGLVATERAMAMVGPLTAAITAADDAVQIANVFDPAVDARTFVLGASDYAEFVGVSAAVRELHNQAPLLNFQVVAPADTLYKDLRDGRIDCAIGPRFRHGFEEPSLKRKKVDSEQFVLLMRKGHPAAKIELDLHALAELLYLQVAPTGSSGGFFDDLLSQHGLRRRVFLRTPHFVSAPFVVAASDLVMVAPENLAQRACRHAKLVVRELPVDSPMLDIFLVWHERTHHDGSHRWFRDFLIRTIAQQSQS